jgi:hypothetical protein
VSAVRAQFLRSVVKRLPPVSRREDRIRELEQHLASGDPLTQPSYRARIYTERRLRTLHAETSVIRGGKLHVYELARSHGIDVPRQFGRWDDPAEIRWDELPDHVVIKSAFSSTSRGVFPLRRREAGWELITRDTILTQDQLTATLEGLIESGRALPPFAAEEFLDEDGTGAHTPTDVRNLCFYGEVPLISLRRSGEHGIDHAARYRFVDEKGEDVLDSHPSVVVDQTIQVPAGLHELVDVASRLSVAIRAPFSRIDLYRIGDRVVFGEVTPRPGGRQWFGPELDLMLGEAWERAEARLARDIAGGMTPEPVFGPVDTAHG